MGSVIIAEWKRTFESGSRNVFFCCTFFFVACSVSITNPPCEGDQFWKTNRSIFSRSYCKFQEMYSVIMFHSSIGLCVLVFVCAGGGPRGCICVRVVIVVCLRIGLGNETKARWFFSWFSKWFSWRSWYRNAGVAFISRLTVYACMQHVLSPKKFVLSLIQIMMRRVSCESWIGLENGCPESFVERNLSLLTAFWSTIRAFLEPRGSLWKHLGIIFGHLCATLRM